MTEESSRPLEQIFYSSLKDLLNIFATLAFVLTNSNYRRVTVNARVTSTYIATNYLMSQFDNQVKTFLIFMSQFFKTI